MITHPPKAGRPRMDDAAIASFTALVDARRAADTEAAAKARRELSRLGYPQPLPSRPSKWRTA